MTVIYENYEEIDWTNCINEKEVRPFLQVVMPDAGHLIPNIHAKVYAIQQQQYIYPITVSEGHFEDSWIVSPYGQYFAALRDEVPDYITNKWIQKLCNMFINLLGRLIKNTGNRIVYVHNYLVSTNLYNAYCPLDINEITKALVARFPGYAIGFRSLNERTAKHWMDKLTAADYGRFASRVIYYWHPAQRLTKGQKKDHRRDRANLKKSSYEVARYRCEDFSAYERIYKQLYLEKYSENNPHYTGQFMKEMKESGLFHFVSLGGKEPIAFGGYFIMNDQMATPFFGWDTAREEKSGIYRMLSNVLYDEARRHCVLMNNSGGAGIYKKSRGCEPELEYNYIYTRHLARKERLAWERLRWIVDTIGTKILWHYR